MVAMIHTQEYTVKVLNSKPPTAVRMASERVNLTVDVTTVHLPALNIVWKKCARTIDTACTAIIMW